MAGQDKAMKIAVEIVNKASPVLKDLQRSMRSPPSDVPARWYTRRARQGHHHTNEQWRPPQRGLETVNFIRLTGMATWCQRARRSIFKAT
jgi:hypothetical protein